MKTVLVILGIFVFMFIFCEGSIILISEIQKKTKRKTRGKYDD